MITITWNTRKFQINLTEADYDTCTVHELKEKCHRITGLPVDEMKLLAYGAVMKKDDAPLSQYGVRPGSKLRLMTSKPNEQEKRPTQESVTLDELHRIQQKLTNTLMPEIDEYQHQVQTYNTTATKTEDAKQKLITRGLYFGEILMQILFDFDGVVCHAGFDQSRQLRKQGVKTSQDLLEKVDRIRDSIA